MVLSDLEVARKGVGCFSEALGVIDSSAEYLTTFYGARPQTIVKDAGQEAAIYSPLSSVEDVSELQTPSSHEVQDKIKWGNNDVLPTVGLPQQVMDPYQCEQFVVYRLRTVEGLKDGDIITSIPSDGLLLEGHPRATYSRDAIALSKDEWL